MFKAAKENVYGKSFIAIHPEMNRILGVLANAQFTIGDSSFTSRVMNYYEEKGLLLSKRENTNEWRRFSAYELVWLEILDKLRSFGYPLEWIKKMRDNMLKDEKAGTVDEEGNYNTRPFEWFIALCLTSKKEFFYIVFEDGAASYYDDGDPHLWSVENSYMRKPHLSIPITQVIKEIWETIPGEKVEFDKSEFIEVDKTEKDILQEVRSGKYESINIEFKNKKPERIVGMERKEIKRIEDVLRENKFQKIELIQKDGKIVSIVSEVSKKL